MLVVCVLNYFWGLEFILERYSLHLYKLLILIFILVCIKLFNATSLTTKSKKNTEQGRDKALALSRNFPFFDFIKRDWRPSLLNSTEINKEYTIINYCAEKYPRLIFKQVQAAFCILL